MSIVIPCASAIGVLGCLMIYHLYLNSTFNGTYKDKLYYEKNKEKVKTRAKEYMERMRNENPDKIKEWRQNSKKE
jgi:hypothetical protein